MNSSVFLPQDLWAEIIGLCSQEDLTSLALTHRFFTPSCADELFRNVIVADWRLETLIPRLKGLSSSRVAPRIRTLRLVCLSWRWDPDLRSEENRNAWISAVSAALPQALENMINLREYLHGFRNMHSIYPFTHCMAISLSKLPRLRRFQLYGVYDDAFGTAVIRNLDEVSINVVYHLNDPQNGGETVYTFLSSSHATLRKLVISKVKSADFARFSSLLSSVPLLEHLNVTFSFDLHTKIHVDAGDDEQVNRHVEDALTETRRWMRALRKDTATLTNLRELRISVGTPDILTKDWHAHVSSFVGSSLEALRFECLGETKYLLGAADILDPFHDLTSLVEFVFPSPEYEDLVVVIAYIARRVPNLRKLELYEHGIVEPYPCRSELKQAALSLAAELCNLKNLQCLMMPDDIDLSDDMLDYVRILGGAVPKLCQFHFGSTRKFIRDANGVGGWSQR